MEVVDVQSLAKELLDTYTLEEVLEMNDIEPEELIQILFDIGRLVFPSHMIRETLDEDYDE